MEPYRVLRLSFFTVLAVSLCSASGAQQTAEVASSVASLTREATFIFVGTVRRLGASTLGDVPSSKSTAVIRVDEVVEAQGAPADLKGTEITVQLAEPGSLKDGEQVTFFTKGWLMGDSLAVVELGHTTEHSDVEHLRGVVASVHQQMADEALQGEIASAEAIVVGTVTDVKPANIRHIGSEHDPDWYEADINIEAVEKGSLPGHAVTVLFPHSDDLMWQGAPKFTKGQQGIWLLHRRQENLPGIGDHFTVLKPLDFQPIENRAHLESLEKTAH